MPLAGILHHTPHPLWDSRRLWSLWEMINFFFLVFEIAMRSLETAIKLERDKPVGAFINNLENEWYRSIFDLVDAKVIAPLKIEETKLTAARLGFLFEKDAAHSHSEAADLLQRLRDEIRAGSSNHFFFHYPKELAALLSSIKDDWADAIAVLPELEREIQAGVDCYAMGDYPGCVFHMMRIAEAGLREIARDVGVK